MGYVMNRDLKFFLREAARHHLFNEAVIIELDDSRFEVRGLTLKGDHTAYGVSSAPGRHRMTVTFKDDQDFTWSFPVNSWTMDSTRNDHCGGGFSMKLQVQAGNTDFVLAGVSVACAPVRKDKLPTTHWEACREIENLRKSLAERDAELAEAKKERDAARYEKLQVEGMISNLRGDLKRLLGL